VQGLKPVWPRWQRPQRHQARERNFTLKESSFTPGCRQALGWSIQLRRPARGHRDEVTHTLARRAGPNTRRTRAIVRGMAKLDASNRGREKWPRAVLHPLIGPQAMSERQKRQFHTVHPRAETHRDRET